MNWSILQKYKMWAGTDSARKIFELGLSLLIGLIVGALFVFSWGLSASWQGLIMALLVVLPFVLLISDLEKMVLAAIAISVPLNLDISLIISPYADNPENVAMGHRIIVALTELRVSLVSVMLLIGYALWIIGNQVSDRKPIRFFASTGIPALGFIFISIFSAYQAQDLQLSFFRIVQLFEMFLLYLYIVNHIRTIQDIQFFTKVLMWGMLAESILMIWQGITGSTFYVAGIQAEVFEPRRVAGTLDNPNVAGGILSGYLAIACVMIWIYAKQSQKIFAIICFVVGCIALIETASRTSWISFAIALLGFVSIGLWRGQIRRETLILLLIAMLIIGLIFYPTIHTRLTADDQGSAESRLRMVRLAWNVIRAHLWLGVGANNYALVAYKYYTSDVGYLGYVINSSVHNRYLLIWAETGLLGLLFYISLLVASLMHVWQCIRSDNRTRFLIALGLGCAIVSISIQMFQEHFSPRPVVLFVWLLVSLAASLRNLDSAVEFEVSR